MGKGVVKYLALLAVFTVFAASVSATTVINSRDWVDVYSGIRSVEDGENLMFVKSSDASRLLGSNGLLTKGDPVHLITSTENPYSTNLKARLEARGFNVSKVTRIQKGEIDLIPRGKENFIVVEQDYPSAALVAAPLAEATDAWVIVVNDGNRQRVKQILSGAEGKVTMVGTFNRETRQAIGSYADKKIIDPSSYALSVKVTKEYLQKKPDTNRFFVTAGRYLENSLVSGNEPVLLTGTNLVPEEIKDFIFRDPSHGLRSAVAIGNEMMSVAQELSDMKIYRNGERTGKEIEVFVKWGTATASSRSPKAIGLFPIPRGDIGLKVGRVRYDPVDERLYVKFINTGSSRLYELTSLRALHEGKEVSTASDSNPVFIGGGDNKTISYSMDLSAPEYQDAVVEFSTSYGTSPSNLQTYLTEKGQFSPPLRKKLKVEKVEESSNVTLEKLVYLKNLDRFKAVLKNHRDEPAYARVSLLDVTVKGESRSFSKGKKKIEGNSEKAFYAVANLDRIDLEQNQEIKTRITFGSRRELLPKTRRRTIKLQVKSGTLTGRFSSTAAGGAVALLVVMLLATVYFRKDKVLEALPR